MRASESAKAKGIGLKTVCASALRSHPHISTRGAHPCSRPNTVLSLSLPLLLRRMLPMLCHFSSADSNENGKATLRSLRLPILSNTLEQTREERLFVTCFCLSPCVDATALLFGLMPYSTHNLENAILSTQHTAHSNAILNSK